jgi:acyl-CoA synthetase (NDP forming)
MAVCGPNCLGVANFARGIQQASMNFPVVDVGIHPRCVGVISQSGGLLIGFVSRATARRVPLHTVVSSGNEAVTGVEDFLDVMLADPEIKVVALICEGFRDLARIKAAGWRAAEAGKRIALLKLGQSVRGRAAVRAHTGREAGEPVEITQVMREAGIAQFNRTDELVEFCRLAAIYPRTRGRKVATVMLSGGAAALVCDIAAGGGLARCAYRAVRLVGTDARGAA